MAATLKNKVIVNGIEYDTLRAALNDANNPVTDGTVVTIDGDCTDETSETLYVVNNVIFAGTGTITQPLGVHLGNADSGIAIDATVADGANLLFNVKNGVATRYSATAGSTLTINNAAFSTGGHEMPANGLITLNGLGSGAAARTDAEGNVQYGFETLDDEGNTVYIASLQVGNTLGLSDRLGVRADSDQAALIMDNYSWLSVGVMNFGRSGRTCRAYIDDSKLSVTGTLTISASATDTNEFIISGDSVLEAQTLKFATPGVITVNGVDSEIIVDSFDADTKANGAITFNITSEQLAALEVNSKVTLLEITGRGTVADTVPAITVNLDGAALTADSKGGYIYKTENEKYTLTWNAVGEDNVVNDFVLNKVIPTITVTAKDGTNLGTVYTLAEAAELISSTTDGGTVTFNGTAEDTYVYPSGHSVKFLKDTTFAGSGVGVFVNRITNIYFGDGCVADLTVAEGANVVLDGMTDGLNFRYDASIPQASSLTITNGRLRFSSYVLFGGAVSISGAGEAGNYGFKFEDGTYGANFSTENNARIFDRYGSFTTPIFTLSDYAYMQVAKVDFSTNDKGTVTISITDSKLELTQTETALDFNAIDGHKIEISGDSVFDAAGTVVFNKAASITVDGVDTEFRVGGFDADTKANGAITFNITSEQLDALGQCKEVALLEITGTGTVADTLPAFTVNLDGTALTADSNGDYIIKTDSGKYTLAWEALGDDGVENDLVLQSVDTSTLYVGTAETLPTEGVTLGLNAFTSALDALMATADDFNVKTIKFTSDADAGKTVVQWGNKWFDKTAGAYPEDLNSVQLTADSAVKLSGANLSVWGPVTLTIDENVSIDASTQLRAVDGAKIYINNAVTNTLYLKCFDINLLSGGSEVHISKTGKLLLSGESTIQLENASKLFVTGNITDTSVDVTDDDLQLKNGGGWWRIGGRTLDSGEKWYAEANLKNTYVAIDNFNAFHKSNKNVRFTADNTIIKHSITTGNVYLGDDVIFALTNNSRYTNEATTITVDAAGEFKVIGGSVYTGGEKNIVVNQGGLVTVDTSSTITTKSLSSSGTIQILVTMDDLADINGSISAPVINVTGDGDVAGTVKVVVGDQEYALGGTFTDDSGVKYNLEFADADGDGFSNDIVVRKDDPYMLKSQVYTADTVFDGTEREYYRDAAENIGTFKSVYAVGNDATVTINEGVKVNAGNGSTDSLLALGGQSYYPPYAAAGAGTLIVQGTLRLDQLNGESDGAAVVDGGSVTANIVCLDDSAKTGTAGTITVKNGGTFTTSLFNLIGTGASVTVDGLSTFTTGSVSFYSNGAEAVVIDLTADDLGGLTTESHTLFNITGTGAFSGTVNYNGTALDLTSGTVQVAGKDGSIYDVSLADLEGNSVNNDLVVSIAEDKTAPINLDVAYETEISATAQRFINFTFSADDPSGIATYTAYLNGTEIYSGSSAEYSYEFFKDFAVGDHTVRFVATDNAGNRSEIEKTITIGDLFEPEAGSIALAYGEAGEVIITISGFTDNVAVTGYNVCLGESREVLATLDAATAEYTYKNAVIGESLIFSVSAFDAAGNESVYATSTIEITDVWSPVTGTVSLEKQGATGVLITMDGFTDNVAVTGYNIYHNGTFLTEVTDPSYLFTPDEMLDGEQTFSVEAFDAAGNVSDAVSATIEMSDVTAPVAGTVTLTQQDANNILITMDGFTDNKGVTKYDIYYGSELIASQQETSYIFSSQEVLNGKYGFTVIAKDAAGNQSEAVAAEIEVKDSIAPVAGSITLKQLDQSTVQITISGYTDNVGVAGYDVFLNNVKVGTTEETTYTYKSPGTIAGSLTFGVSAFDAAGNQSAVISETLYQAGGVLGKATEKSTTIIWDAAEMENPVRRYEITVSGSKRVYRTTKTNIKLKKLEAGDHTITVTAVDRKNNREVVVEMPVTVIDGTDPRGGRVKLKQVGQDSVQISISNFKDNVGVAAYDIYLDDTKVATTTSDTYTYEGEDLGGRLKFSVVAVDAAGNESKAKRAYIRIKDTTAPDQVTGLSVAAGADQKSAVLSWDAANDNVGVVRYEIAVSGSKRVYRTKKTSINIKKLAAGEHTFTVTAIDKARNESVASESFTFDVADITAPKGGKVKLTQQGQDSVQIDISKFTDNVGVARYDIYLDDTKVGSTTTGSYLYEGEDLDGRLKFGVVAVDEAGNESRAKKAYIRIKDVEPDSTGDAVSAMFADNSTVDLSAWDAASGSLANSDDILGSLEPDSTGDALCSADLIDLNAFIGNDDAGAIGSADILDDNLKNKDNSFKGSLA